MVVQMPSITLKDLPRDLHRRLKLRAKAHRRSLNGEVIATLQAATSAVAQVDPEMMVREAREARTRFKRSIAATEISAWKKRGRL
jgi:plasmid stability protein